MGYEIEDVDVECEADGIGDVEGRDEEADEVGDSVGADEQVKLGMMWGILRQIK